MDFIKEAKKTSKRASGEIVARLIIDTKKEKILFIPDHINHPEYLAAYLGKKDKQELKQDPDLVSHYVGAAVGIEDGKVTRVLVGISGLELYFGTVRSPLHKKAQVNKARNILLAELANEGLLTKEYKLQAIYK